MEKIGSLMDWLHIRYASFVNKPKVSMVLDSIETITGLVLAVKYWPALYWDIQVPEGIMNFAYIALLVFGLLEALRRIDRAVMEGVSYLTMLVIMLLVRAINYAPPSLAALLLLFLNRSILIGIFKWLWSLLPFGKKLSKKASELPVPEISLKGKGDIQVSKSDKTENNPFTTPGTIATPVPQLPKNGAYVFSSVQKESKPQEVESISDEQESHEQRERRERRQRPKNSSPREKA